MTTTEDASLDLEARWPELFEPLTVDEHRTVRNILANNWHEGWQPNRDDVADLAAYVHGDIDESEYNRRSFTRTQLRGTDA